MLGGELPLWIELVALGAAGLGAGFFNTVAGGGSLLSLGALMALGLPAGLANGTNRVAIVAQSATGLYTFTRGGALPREGLALTVLPTVLGAIAGALVATRLPAAILEPALLGTMALMALVLTFRPKLVMAEPGEAPRSAKRLGAQLGLFGAGLYGGFVQAGVGFVLLAVLGGLLRHEIRGANAIKLACTLTFSIAALAVFVLAGDVTWPAGLVLALAMMVGAHGGARFALRVPTRVLRAVLLIAVIGVIAAVLARSG